MSLKGKWRIVEMPDFDTGYPDLVEPAYILFEGAGSGGFIFGCCTGHIWEESRTEAEFIHFSWDGSDEMDDVSGDGSAELRPDGRLEGKFCFRNGDDWSFVAQKWTRLISDIVTK